jgi:hypothetical protein|tara:strand:+ start:707 stop:1030 length:324 start_codon:yes stop_codon:yes gene_type:complete
MEDEPIWMDFDKNDFVITLTPAINKKDNRWTGEIMLNHCSTQDNDMHPEDCDSMVQMINMLFASIPLMEHDIEFRNKLYNHAKTMVKEDDKPKIIDKIDNVINVNFN